MTKRHFFWLALAVMLAAGLTTAPPAARAQEAQVYTWAPYGLSVRVPAGWAVVEAGGVVSLHPAGRDVSDGQGPELILFTQAAAGNLDAQIAGYAGAMTGTTGPVESGTLDGYPVRAFRFDQTTPDTQGGVKLIALDAQTVIGLAYTVRDGEAGTFLAALEGMYNSATFGPLGVDAPVTFDPRAPDTPTYQDASYGYALHYPPDWVVVPQADQGEIVLRPSVSDWPEGTGPEFVIVVVDHLANAELYGLMAHVTRDRSGDFGVPLMGMIDGRSTLLVTYTNSGQNPPQNGGVLLIRLDDRTVLAIGYHAPAGVYATYGPVFDAIRQSLRFPGAMAVTPSITSVGTASVQLPQRYVWEAAGLALYYPTAWKVTEDLKSGESVVYAVPERRQGADRLIQATTLPYVSANKLPDIVNIARRAYGSVVTDPVSVTVAGYPGLVFEVRDTTEQPVFYIRMLALSVPDYNTAALFMFAIEEQAWDEYRPLASAFVGSIETLDASRAGRLPDRLFAPPPGGSAHGLAARVSPDAYTAQPQDGTGTKPFEWEESGLTVAMPESWQVITAGQNFDFALVSPEAYASGSGSFITFRDIPYIGKTIEDLTNALQTVADQVGSVVEPYKTASGLAGVAVNFTDTDANTIHHLVLLSYGETGSALYLQTSATTEADDALVLASLDTLAIDPPKSDYAAVDAAWQASLAADGTLTYGSVDAPVSMVEYLSMTCGHCATYSVGMDRLIALEVETGRVRIEMGMLAGDPYSALATKAVYCAAAQGKGYTAYKALWQGYFEDGYDVAYTADGVSARLGDLGLDMDALNTCIDEDTYAASTGTVRQSFTDHGLTGTPTVLLGQGDAPPDVLTLPDGQVWSGTIPIATLREMIAGAIDNGIPFEDYFKQ